MTADKVPFLNSPILKQTGKRKPPPWLADLHQEMGEFALLTSKPGWLEDSASGQDILDEAVPTARGKSKPIGVRLWGEAFFLAIALSMELPGLPQPEPGADYDGAIWLSWENQKGRLALKLDQSLGTSRSYSWDKIVSGVKQVYSSHSLRDVAEALKAVFGHSEKARKSENV